MGPHGNAIDYVLWALGPLTIPTFVARVLARWYLKAYSYKNPDPAIIDRFTRIGAAVGLVLLIVLTVFVIPARAPSVSITVVVRAWFIAVPLRA